MAGRPAGRSHRNELHCATASLNRATAEGRPYHRWSRQSGSTLRDRYICLQGGQVGALLIRRDVLTMVSRLSNGIGDGVDLSRCQVRAPTIGGQWRACRTSYCLPTERPLSPQAPQNPSTASFRAPTRHVGPGCRGPRSQPQRRSSSSTKTRKPFKRRRHRRVRTSRIPTSSQGNLSQILRMLSFTSSSIIDTDCDAESSILDLPAPLSIMARTASTSAPGRPKSSRITSSTTRSATDIGRQECDRMRCAT